MSIREYLISQKEDENARFIASLSPDMPADRFLGVRIPLLRRYAKEIGSTAEARAFLDELPHTYFEENVLHAILISNLKGKEECFERLETFLPFVDCWGVCDTLKPLALAKDRDLLLERAKKWMGSDHVFTKRYGVKVLMDFFLGENFEPSILLLPASIHTDAYYVNMMIAWFLATALAKQWDATIPLFERDTFDVWVHNKAIQKAKESFRVSPEHKENLKKLKRQ